MNFFITWNAKVVVPIAVEMNNNVLFPSLCSFYAHFVKAIFQFISKYSIIRKRRDTNNKASGKNKCFT